MLEVGQKLWYVPNYGHAREVTITTVGRKWATFDALRRRVDVETLKVDGGNYDSPGRCYQSREEYEEKVALQIAWDTLRRQIALRSLPSCTIEAINEAWKLLGLPQKKK